MPCHAFHVAVPLLILWQNVKMFFTIFNSFFIAFLAPAFSLAASTPTASRRALMRSMLVSGRRSQVWNSFLPSGVTVVLISPASASSF